MSRQSFPVGRGLHWFLRVCLGVIVLGAGAGKALDLPGFAGVLKTYELGLPEAALWPVATFVTLFELGLGSWILSGRRLGGAALLSAAMHFGYLVLLIGALRRGLEIPNCGCFGVFLARPLDWHTPIEDAALIAASYGLFYLSGEPRRGGMSVAPSGAANAGPPGAEMRGSGEAGAGAS